MAKPLDPRRELTIAVLGCAVSAGLALFASTRTWLVVTTARPQPLPPEVQARHGGDLVPVLSALALVGLAGAAALLATRGRARFAVGVLLAASGLGVFGAALAGYLGNDGASLGWAVLAMLGGVGIAVCGVQTLRRSARWPAMGARYERAAPPDDRLGPSPLGQPRIGPVGRRARADHDATADRDATPDGEAHRDRDASAHSSQWWDAIDRGVDPTADDDGRTDGGGRTDDDPGDEERR